MLDCSVHTWLCWVTCNSRVEKGLQGKTEQIKTFELSLTMTAVVTGHCCNENKSLLRFSDGGCQQPMCVGWIWHHFHTVGGDDFIQLFISGCSQWSPDVGKGLEILDPVFPTTPLRVWWKLHFYMYMISFKLQPNFTQCVETFEYINKSFHSCFHWLEAFCLLKKLSFQMGFGLQCQQGETIWSPTIQPSNSNDI